MDKHDVISRLKDLAVSTGKTPTRDEFIKQVPKSVVEKLFGTYSVLIQASGLEKHEKQEKACNSIS